MNVTVKQGITEESIAKIASQVAAELRPMLEPAKPNQPKETEELRKENAELKTKLGWMENEIQAIKNYLRELAQNSQAKESPAKPAEPIKPETTEPKPSQPEPGKAENKQEVDEEKAEKWLRDNLAEWLDQPCPFKQAGGRTWRQLGKNEGEKIAMNGKGQQAPRAYLHALESWQSCKPWPRLKAKVALDMGKNGTGN